MKCENVEKLLLLEDSESRVDLAGLEKHLESCAACRSAHPDVAWLLAQAQGASVASSAPLPRVELHRDVHGRASRRGLALTAVAAAVVLAVAAVGFRGELFPSVSHGTEGTEGAGVIDVAQGLPAVSNADSRTVHAPAQAPAQSRPATPAGGYSSYESTSVTWHNGRRITSTVERSVWRAHRGQSSSREPQ